MKGTSSHYQAIHREAIKKINFPNNDVLQCPEERKLRSGKIHEATRLGNLEHRKVKIIFQDGVDSTAAVHTTIWAQTTEKVFLKNKVHIPVNRIIDIVFDTP